MINSCSFTFEPITSNDALCKSTMVEDLMLLTSTLGVVILIFFYPLYFFVSDHMTKKTLLVSYLQSCKFNDSLSSGKIVFPF
jgi:hypothetical protein